MSLRLDETEIRVIKLKTLIEAYTLLSIDSKAIHDLNPDDLKNWSDELEELTRDGNYLDVFPSEWDVSMATSALTYQGEKQIDITTHPDYKDMTTIDWVMYFIEKYGGYDGSHHKDWVLDQVARIVHGTPIVVKHATWSDKDKPEVRINTGEPSQKYLDWVEEMKVGVDGEDTYDYNEGIAP